MFRVQLRFSHRSWYSTFHSEGTDSCRNGGGLRHERTHYSQLTDADRKEFLGWISPLTPRDFGDRVVLDAGCGKGRHIFLAAQFKARTVVGVDLSDAVEAAYPAAVILILIVPTD